ncbi:Lrp/AsnC family transcriptional regulator [Spirosoma radiotolerans]|uniref:AsnC family transcriptional regulator n=1 Tax=Spirosoma radiotolerans TaxID=1379870 RepID=A0A0E3ZUT5_9BACT|nr:Lrp/AsnC family transcriptional regulator [Spirosoma radiotolerans]AKD55419.1 AsnC family transcriptional regulator [Spirosoma radiotolerans]
MLDDTDFRLLSLLQRDAKRTIKELAEELGMTTTPIFERIKRMERDGVIEAYVALVNQEKIGRPLIVFCNVSMPDYTPDNIAEFENQVRRMPDVLEAYHLAGTIDYQLKVVMSDIKEYANFLQQMAKLPMIRVYSSSIALYAVKQSTILPLPTKNTIS